MQFILQTMFSVFPNLTAFT